MTPPTLTEMQERGLVVPKGIHTFSNGSEWECWSGNNCDDCRHYQECWFEEAALLGMVSPEMAALFGWTERNGSWESPVKCPFFRADNGDDEDPPPPLVDPDPLQLVLLADPTEDAAILTGVEVPEPVECAS